MNEFEIENKKIKIYIKNNTLKELPVVVLNCFEDDTDNIFDECIKANCNDFILVTIHNLHWNSDMTPYYAPKIYKNDSDYAGKAEEYIHLLEEKIIPEVKKSVEEESKIKITYFAIAGYSLGGLFAIYSLYQTNLFARAVSASGSLWYPFFIDFIKKNKLKNKVDKIYFSLGNKESKTKNKILSSVEENTKEIEKFYEECGIKVLYEENEGNHFGNPNLRMAKGIKWILEE